MEAAAVVKQIEAPHPPGPIMRRRHADLVWTTLRVRIVGIEVIAAPQAEAAHGTARLVLHGVDF